MCGICGMIDLAGQGRADLTQVQRMADAIRHRGPDGEGFYNSANVVLGMRRLSIIDVGGSNQPLYNEDHTIALVFNGEIYNYRELRELLKRHNHILNTEGDGETIIHLYEEYGLNLFSHLRGMFGFALWDSNLGRLILAVDHIGMKPLYIHESNGKLLFASEAKALFSDPGVPRNLNLDLLDTYLSFGFMIDGETLFEDVSRLPPGCAYVIEPGKAPYLHPFWQFPKPIQDGRTQPDSLIIKEAGDLIAESVHIHLRSDVPLGLFLSGGIDSAAILGLMAQEANGRIKTYTVGYDIDTPYNELRYAERIAKHFQTDHHERVIMADDWWNGLVKSIYYHDEPIANSSAIPLLLLAEETVKDVKVVLTGLGGDELFGGYYTHNTIPQMLANNKSWGHLLEPFSETFGLLEKSYPSMKRHRVIGALPTYLPRLRQATLPRNEAILRAQSFDGLAFTDSLRKSLYSPDLLAAWKAAKHKERANVAIVEKSWRDNPYDTAQAVIINTWLAGNGCLHFDKVTMASSLETRIPFFDPVLLKFAANVPPALRMRNNKYVLREAMRPYVPEFALERPKQHFNSPLSSWFDNQLSGNIREVLLNPNSFINDLFDRKQLERLLKDHLWKRTSQVEVVFRLLVLELWGQRFIKPPLFSTQ